MLIKRLLSRMRTLDRDIDSLYEMAKNREEKLEARVIAAATLAHFLTSTERPLERWLLDTLLVCLGLGMATVVAGRADPRLWDDVLLVKSELSHRTVRQLEGILERLATRGFSGTGMTPLVVDEAALERVYATALQKAAQVPSSRDNSLDVTVLEKLLAQYS